MTKYYDIGLNLFCRQFSEPDRIIAEAADEGVSCIITGSDMKSSEKAARYVRDHECWSTCGIHPHSASSADARSFRRIREIVSGNSKVVAVGECGLDYDRMFSPKDKQLSCLEEHIRIAEELGKPLFLHERDAFEDFVSVFEKHRDICRTSVVHCFTGSRKVLEKYLDMGFSIGVTGWICDDRRGQELRDAVKIIPLDRIMAETDAPYLTPRNIPGLSRTNHPCNIKYVAAALAEYMGTDEALLIEKLRENTERFFGIDQTAKGE